MCKPVSLLVLAALAVSSPAFCQTPYPGEHLVWSDDFDSPTLDRTRWSFEVGGGGFGNNEMQWYKAQNARVDQGVLVIETKREKTAGWPYSSAKMMSRDSWTYGTFVVRAKVPVGVGSWPAVWMLPDQPKEGPGIPWPDGGEIDIMEHVGFDPGVIHFTAHTGAFNHRRGTQKTSQVRVPDASSAFHEYGVHWTPDALEFLLDGQVVYRFDNPRATGQEWPFDRPFHWILNTAAGGDWGGQQGVDNASLPWTFSIDWVRVYRADN